MNHGKVAAVFAGQGVLEPVGVEPGPLRDQIQRTFQDIDRVAIDRLGVSLSHDILKGARSWNVRDAAPEFIQLAVFGLSVATYAYRENCGWRPSVLVGHGLGEIMALVAGGVFSVSEGAEIVCERAAVLKTFARGSGSMIDVSAGADKAEKLVAGGEAAVAAENSANDTVIAGSYAALDAIVRKAKKLDIAVKKLAAPYPLHYEPLMRAAAAAIARRLALLRGKAPRIPIFSPILGRYYEEFDAPGESVAQHLVKPIRFFGAVCTLSAHGVDTFESCGVLEGANASVARAASALAA